ncbi:aspartate dehydrogenase [Sphingobacterium sp. ML3W]|uniref:aspartate dehydrogenase domain-containing protein n=1 Tax=Sphingobacterium sp. ML3W TaxID=1538644 RepID=UPI0004F849E3|nr:aspartate dehydrogenase domain-containing protein [Sphingobacterium sp. ML3W]AIM37067.1 aspartate dehydrogenase [Sphingobacterium sp. ML3W]
MKTYTLAIVGCGRLATIVTDALNRGLLPDYKLMATYSRTAEKAQSIADKIDSAKTGYSCTACGSIEELLSLKPDYIIEAASPYAMRELALPALRNGSSIITLSIGAFANTEFYEEVKQTAKENNARVHLVSGAIGGFDVMRTAALMGNCVATFDTEKSPHSLRKSSVYDETLETAKRTVFRGNAKEAIALFPTSVNVAVAASLASVGPENIKVSVTSTPNFIGDNHRIEVKNEQVHAVIDVYSSTAQIAGWSVVNTLINITSPIVF